MKKNILVVTGTRAEYGLLRSTMDAIREHPLLSLRLLVTGMHTQKTYGETLQEIRKDGYVIDSIVPISEDNDQLQSLQQEIGGIRDYCLRERPDCILVLGDRDEPFAATIVAAHLNIAISHIHGGDITGPGVDESIRHAITKFAHIHFPGTKKSARRIKSLAEDPKRIFFVGSVVIDMLQEQRPSRAVLAKDLGLDENRPWLTVVQHPTAFDIADLKKQIDSTLTALASFPEFEKIILYPNNDSGSEIFITAIKNMENDPHVRIVKSLPRNVFMSTVAESKALIGNSSAGIIETAYLGTPTVNVGNRQRGRERGRSVIDVSYDPREIASAISRAIELKDKKRGKPFPSPYGIAGAGKKIADILATQLSRNDLLDKKWVTA